MKKNKSEAGNQSVIAIILKAVICGAAVVVVVYFVGLLILLWGLSKRPSRHNTKEEYQKQCKTELESWFAEQETSASWDGKFSLVRLDSKIALAAEGSFQQGGKNVDFLCVPSGSFDSLNISRIYVSALPERQEKEIFERLFYHFPFTYQAQRLYAGHTILIPTEYELGNNYVFITRFRTSGADPNSMEARFERRLLWARLDGELLDEPVPSARVDDVDTPVSDPEQEFRRFERKVYLESTWRENLGVEVFMPADIAAEHVEELVAWVESVKICEAVFHGADSETLTITKSYILKAEGITEPSGQAWVEHWTVTFGDSDAEPKTTEKPLHYDIMLRTIEARVDDDGVCRVYYTDDGKEQNYYGHMESDGSFQRPSRQVVSAVYLGVEGYGLAWTTKEYAQNFRYLFLVDDKEGTHQESYKIPGNPDPEDASEYTLQNRLKVGYTYWVVKDGYEVCDLREAAGETGDYAYRPRVRGTPGEKTVLNFLKTALMPVGTTLYVYGGGWDWYDEGAGPQTRSIGVSPDWVRFFREQTVDYTFRDVDDDVNKRDPKTSYYPFGGFNQYFYAGLDCSGFVGWALYNTFETEDGRDGYVCSSTKMARTLADAGYGEITQDLIPPTPDNGVRIKPGDIVSIKGHVWVSLGTCEDGSVVIVHSTNGFVSRTGQPGGGVAIGAIGTTTDCEAYRLAERYMRKYFPQWDERYTVALSNPETYFHFEGDVAGWFSWNPESAEGLTDEEHVQDMTPAEVLRLCFGE